MNACKKFRQHCTEALYEKLDSKDSKRFNEHKSTCTECNSLFVEMKSTLNLMDNVERPEPKPEFWQNYWRNLEDRLEDARPARTIIPGWKLRISQLFESRPRLAIQLAGGFALLLIGILIGKNIFTTDIPQGTLSLSELNEYKTVVAKAAINQRADRFLQRSKLLLLGLVNLDDSSEEPLAINFAHQRQISQQLIEETSVLKDDLGQSDQIRLRELISDLELVLLQIANLEVDKDLPAIELVKSTASSRSILLRINLEEMRKLYENEQIPVSPNKSKIDQTI